MTREPLTVIGIGADGPAGLAPDALDHVRRAAVLAGGRRHLDFFPEFMGETILIDADLAGLVGRLREAYPSRKTVVLASGDPLFFGIGRRLLDAFPREDLLFLPHLSSIQLAFARVREAWGDACVVSLHGRPLDTLIPALHRREPKIAVLTDAVNDPPAVARLLEEHGCGDAYRVWTCENLGGQDERVRCWNAVELRGKTFDPLNVVILVRRLDAVQNPVPTLGISESLLEHRAGVITKREVRLLSLCYLELGPGEVLWDIGAGSGSVAIEAAHVVPRLRAFAVERSSEAIQHIKTNVQQFGLRAIEMVEGEAPAALASLPDPDAVFVGGSGGRLREIVAEVARRLKPGGRLVVNCVTVENFARGWDYLRENGMEPAATSVQLAHTRPLGGLNCLEPDKPLFMLRAKR